MEFEGKGTWMTFDPTPTHDQAAVPIPASTSSYRKRSQHAWRGTVRIISRPASKSSLRPGPLLLLLSDRLPILRRARLRNARGER